MPNDLILVTGGSGFLGSHCLLAAVNAGYRIRTTVRSLSRADEVREMLRSGGASEDRIVSVEFAEADLINDEGWDRACKGCKYILHNASPFPGKAPKDENDLFEPAVGGTLRVLKAAKAAGTVERVVLTASTACMVFGHSDKRLASGPFTETDHTNLDNPSSPVPAYSKSKTLAERAAWDFIKNKGDGMELVTIHPCGIYGPVLSQATASATSISLIEWLMNGTIPMIPQLGFGVVDVRDVAALHLLALTSDKAAGQRFLAVGDEYIDAPMVGQILREELEEKAKRVPTWTAPNLLLKFVGLSDAQMGGLSYELGRRKEESNSKAKKVSGWRPRSQRESIVDTARSLERLGKLKG